MSSFGATHAQGYLDGPSRQVPGLSGLHRMASLLLAERMPEDGRVLVLGAGGGLELKAFADFQPGWSFDGVDPSAEMLALARHTVREHGDRFTLQHGFIDSAPSGPFDGATSLLTFHFIPQAERLNTLGEIRKRLKPGAPFVAAHISITDNEPERSRWLARHIAFGSPGDVDSAQIEKSREIMTSRLTIMSPEEDERMIRAAGFEDVSLFYAGFSFRGWVGYAA